MITVACLPLFLVRSHILLWACVGPLSAASSSAFRGLLTGPICRGQRPSRRSPACCHLGYEDPSRPGAGGGSVRTHEINRRLSGFVRYHRRLRPLPAQLPREEDGVRLCPRRHRRLARRRLHGAIGLLRTHSLGALPVPVGPGHRGFRCCLLDGRRSLDDDAARSSGSCSGCSQREEPAVASMPFSWVERRGRALPTTG